MRFKPTGFYVLDLVWAKAPCWPGGALAPVKHVYLKSSVVSSSQASGFVPPSWAAPWPSSASTPAALHLPYGIKGHLASAEGKMKAHPNDLPRAPAPFQCRTVTRPLWWREEPSALSRQVSIGAAQPAGGSRDWMHPVLAHTPIPSLHPLLLHLPMMVSQLPPSQTISSDTLGYQAPKNPKPWRVTAGAEAMECD